MLKAFTLVELLVAMVITSIIIYFTYFYLDSSTKFFNLYKSNNTTINNSINTVSLLALTYDLADSMRMNPIDQTISFSGKDIMFSFGKNEVIRKMSEETDSLPTGEIHFFVNDVPPEEASSNSIQITFNELDYKVTFLKSPTVIDLLSIDENLKKIRNGRN
jgi:prepilin-type N-terminal cleavage/methylation domain-containing protein